MQKIFSEKNGRIPQLFDNIQVNFCKNPICPNYGIAASPKKQPRGRHAPPEKRDGYIKRNQKGVFHLICKHCGESFPLKSNQGIAEEYFRLTRYAPPLAKRCCMNRECPNFEIEVTGKPQLYRKSGRTSSGSQRYLCKSCQTTFSEPKKSTARQRKADLNRYIFLSLVNKVPLRGISEIYGVSMDTVYRKIDFLYDQCAKFLEAREARLLRGMKLPKMYIAVDRQFYAVNWKIREDKRNVILYGVASADNTTGYVLSNDVNYDFSVDPEEIEAEVVRIGDDGKNIAFRRHARLWLQQDYIAALQQLKKKTKLKRLPVNKQFLDLQDYEIHGRYSKLRKRADVEVSEDLNSKMQLPETGMMVRMDYCLYGHFMRLRSLLKGAEKIRFFMDQESGIRAACLSVFHREIMARVCDAFYISTVKTMTVDEREYIRDQSARILAEYCEKNRLSKKEGRLELLKENVEIMNSFGQWNDRWFTHPLPTFKEPGIKVCHLTDFGDYDLAHRAWLYNKASLHAVNTYFANVRRKLSALERPLATPSSLGRKWYAYSPYNPALVNKLLLIHRVYYNFVSKRGQNVTPAMKLGLAKAPVAPEDIIYSRGLSYKRKQSLDFQPANKDDDFFKGPEPDSLREIRLRQLRSKPGRPKLCKNIETVYLDTETTGVTLHDQIIEIAIVDKNGTPLVNSLVRTTRPVHKEAKRLHGLTRAKVSKAPSLAELEDTIIKAVKGKHAVSYNIEFDLRFLTGKIRDAITYVSCCMRAYARYRGELTEYDSYRWFSLNEACKQIGYVWEGECHRALSDALACRAVWRKIHN